MLADCRNCWRNHGLAGILWRCYDLRYERYFALQDISVFSYSLVADDETTLELRGEELLGLIREHAIKHDFAQRIHVDEVSVEVMDIDNERKVILLLPFHKEYFSELATLNRYIVAQASKIGLRVTGLVLPDSSCIQKIITRMKNENIEPGGG